MVAPVLGLVVALAVVTAGAEALVRGASVLALRAGVSALFVGLTVVGIGTSAPELAASVFASLQGSSGIAVGNVVGSNTFNICVILGVTALIHPIRVELRAVRTDILVVIAVACAPFVAVAFGREIPRGVGLVFVVALVVYLALAFRAGRRALPDQEQLAGEELRSTLAIGPSPKLVDRVSFNLLLVLVGLACLLLGSRWFVASAVELATAQGLSERVVGLTIVSAGTSLPELVTSIVAARRRNPDIVVGNVIGSNVFNVLGALGVSSIVRPQHVAPTMLTLDLPLMLLASICLLPIVWTGGKISRTEGGVLAVGYAAYVAWLLAA